MSTLHNLGSTSQRPNETVAYTVDVSNVGSSPTVDSVTIVDVTDTGNDLSSTLLSGSSSVSSDVITTPLVTGLTDGTRYRVTVQYSIGGETFEDYFEIACEDDF